MGKLKSNGKRFLANHGNDTTLQQLSSSNGEQIGRLGLVQRDKEVNGRNLFSLSDQASL